MGIHRLIFMVALTFSVTATARFSPVHLLSPAVTTAYSQAPGLWFTGQGAAQVETGDDGVTHLSFLVQGQISDHFEISPEADVKGVQTFTYFNYGERATAELKRVASAPRTPELFFNRPIVIVQYPASMQIYSVDIRGKLSLMTSLREQNANLVRAFVTDPTGRSRGIDLDLIQFGFGQTARYYSPELRAAVNRTDVIRIKEDSDFLNITPAERLRLRTLSAKAADALEAAEEASRNTQYVYTGETQKSEAVNSIDRVFARMRDVETDPLLPRRLLERQRILTGTVVSAEEHGNILKKARNNLASAIKLAEEVLTRYHAPATACETHVVRKSKKEKNK